MNAFERWRRLSWLRQGFCPNCYSSPPLLTCPICEGSHGYGPDLTSTVRAAWRSRFDSLVARDRRSIYVRWWGCARQHRFNEGAP